MAIIVITIPIILVKVKHKYTNNIIPKITPIVISSALIFLCMGMGQLFPYKLSISGGVGLSSLIIFVTSDSLSDCSSQTRRLDQSDNPLSAFPARPVRYKY